MKSPVLLALLASAASSAHAAIEWTAGGWHTIAAYAEENQLIARALASEANYASDVTRRLCVDRTFALQEKIVEGVSRELSYYSWGCEMSSAGGQCATAEPRGETCASYDVSLFVDLKTNGVSVVSISKHGAAGGGDRGTPPSLIPTTRPPSTPSATPMPTTSEPTTTTTPATTTPSPTTPAPTVVTATDPSQAGSSITDGSASRGAGQSEEEPSSVTTTTPTAVPVKPTPAPTKSGASARTVAGSVAVTITAVMTALL